MTSRSANPAPDPHRLKALQTRRRKMAAHLENIKREIADAQKYATVVGSDLGKLDEQIKELEAAAAEPLVSEHAMLRYMERVVGVDLDEVRAAILDPGTVEQIRVLGSGVYPRGKFRIRVRGNTVVTVLEGGNAPR